MDSLRSLDEVVAAILALPAADSAGGTRVVIGLTGQPGSGKSTVAAAVVDRLGPTAGLLPMDGFHLPQARLVELGRRDRMGAPDTFDVTGFIDLLTRVKRGDTVAAPGFDRTIEEAMPEALHIQSDTRFVLIEGNYLLHTGGGWQASAPLFDLRLYLDIDQDLRLERLIARHIRFGKTPNAARAWALGPDETNAKLIAATAWHADHLVRLD